MSQATRDVKRVITDMIEDRQLYMALHDLLAQQRQLIIARRPAELEALNPQLLATYQALSQSSRRRYQLLTQLGLPVNATGMQRLLACLPATHRSKVTAMWEDLASQAKRCKAANEYNGLLLSMQQDILQNLMCISEPENWLYQQR